MCGEVFLVNRTVRVFHILTSVVWAITACLWIRVAGLAFFPAVSGRLGIDYAEPLLVFYLDKEDLDHGSESSLWVIVYSVLLWGAAIAVGGIVGYALYRRLQQRGHLFWIVWLAAGAAIAFLTWPSEFG